MDKALKLVGTRLPKFIAELRYSNEFLKIFSLSCLGLSIISCVVSVCSINRSPVVLAFSKTADPLKEAEFPSADEQIKAAVRSYVEHRYNWTPENVDKQLNGVKASVSSKAKEAFLNAKDGIVKFSKEKGVSQKVYVDSVSVDLEKETAEVRGERITLVQGMRAASSLKLVLDFESSKRSKENPWGVYILKEKEVVQ